MDSNQGSLLTCFSRTWQRQRFVEPSPCFSPEDQHPAPLPTDGEIYGSTVILKDETGRKVVRVGQHFIVEYGGGVSVTEGQNMLFVHDICPSIRIPNVYALYSRTHATGKETGYIVMEYIQGLPLDAIWEGLDDFQKNSLSKRFEPVLRRSAASRRPGTLAVLVGSHSMNACSGPVPRTAI